VSSARLHRHILLAQNLAGAAMRYSIHHGAALKADSHATESPPRLSGDGDPARLLRKQHRRCNCCASYDSVRGTVDRH